MRQKRPRPAVQSGPAADLYLKDAATDNPFGLSRQTPRCTCRDCVLRSVSRAWMQLEFGHPLVAQEILHLVCMDLVEAHVCGSASLAPYACAR
jgi:hypothetical protein